MAKNSRSNGIGIIGLIIGILSAIWAFFLPGGAVVSLVLGIIAIILGRVSKRRNGRNAPATAGVVLGIIGIILFVIVLILVLFSI